MEKSPLQLLIDIAERTARMEEKLDTVIEDTDDHEKRIRSIERFRYAVPGAGVIAALAALVAFLPHH